MGTSSYVYVTVPCAGGVPSLSSRDSPFISISSGGTVASFLVFEGPRSDEALLGGKGKDKQ